MVYQDSLLVTLLHQVDLLPIVAEPVHRKHGRPKVYTDRVFIKALLVMIVCHFGKVHEFYAALQQPTREMLEFGRQALHSRAVARGVLAQRPTVAHRKKISFYVCVVTC